MNHFWIPGNATKMTPGLSQRTLLTDLKVNAEHEIDYSPRNQ